MAKQTKIKDFGAPPDAMLRATAKANSKTQDNKSLAYYFGNMGDSIERRVGPGWPGLGNGNDAGQGILGGANMWQAGGFGNYFGSGLLNGYGRMFSGVHSGMGATGFTYLRRFSSQSAFNHQVIAQCMMAYLGYGVVKNIVDLYSDFATGDIDIYHENISVRNFYNTWASKVNLNERAHSMFVNLFTSGQCFVHRRWADLDPSEKQAMKRAEGAQNLDDNTLLIRGKIKDTTIFKTESDFIDFYLSNYKGSPVSDILKKANSKQDESPDNNNKPPENKKNQIPWGYTYLNPLQMEIRGKKIRGEHYWVMCIDKKDTLDIAKGLGMSTRVDLGTTEINLPKEFVNRISKYIGESASYSTEVKLTDEELSVVQAPGKWDWFDWAVPFIFPALKNLSFKDCLRSMEMRACQSVLNSIFLFKLGKLEKGFPADEDMFERLADMIQMPGNTLNIIWNDLIDASVIQADINGIFDTKKHDSADKDILTALGIPEVLIGGKGGNYSNSYHAVAGVLEKLNSYRQKVTSWIMGELKIIADTMGFRKMPSIRFKNIDLQDDKARQSFLIQLYDRNIISADTVLRDIDTNVEIESSKLKEEQKIRGTNVLEARGPFIKVPPTPGGPPGGQMPKTPNGRPSGTPTGKTGTQTNKRAPKGKGLGNLLDLYETYYENGKLALSKIEEFCNSKYLNAIATDNAQIKHIKQLRQADKERLENLIYNVFSHMPPPQKEEDFSDDFITNLLKSDAVNSVKKDVLDVYVNKSLEYTQLYGKVPTREERRKFIVSAWTQSAMRSMISNYDI